VLTVPSELPLKNGICPGKTKVALHLRSILAVGKAHPINIIPECSSATHHKENNSASFSIVFDCSSFRIFGSNFTKLNTFYNFILAELFK
jgi:hypothetical protein